MIDPSATLPQDYRLTSVTLEDGTLVSGNIAAETGNTLTLRMLGGDQVLDKKDIAERKLLEQSLMPEGLLTPLSLEDVRDLVAYLQGAAPAASRSTQ